MITEIQSFAILDAAAEPAVPEMLKSLNPDVVCLFHEPVADDFASVAPYLVRVDSEVSAWLKTRKTPWGILISSASELIALRDHLRHLLKAYIPGQLEPVLIRYYDPRLIWGLLDSLDARALHDFLGPIIEVVTTAQGQYRSASFEAKRRPFQKTAYIQQGPLHLNQFQYDLMLKSSRQVMLQRVAARIRHQLLENDSDEMSRPGQLVYTLSVDDPVTEATDIQNSAVDPECLAEELVEALAPMGITDTRSLTGLAELFVKRRVLGVEDMPVAWHRHLSDTKNPGSYRAETLLNKELGYIPA
ncbi:hypothetical protein ADIMK_0216 [Marinobacterium lacunae]|uniref:DUF4123 domain-containing protein n=1 Tax=Marinobacterium lacunae TaxID=1232683 RepID=A0A081G3A4_9GAMM|nr:DUF4123 domain-containing protein [Marinobacterium lacunae]KEA65259.1 hypothetical protein ADIMK_0216 [Marinobacterium lacunae]